MDKLRMESPDLTQANIEKLALQHHIGQHLPQQFKIDRLFQLAVLTPGLSHAGGE